MYEEALSMLNPYSDNRRASFANKKVTLLRRLKKWETLSKFLRELESDRWFDKWNPMLNVYLALSYCELGRFDELEEVVLAGLSKSPQGEEAAHLHLFLAIVMAKQSRTSSALTEYRKAIQLGREDDERIQWSGIGYLFLEYGEYELASICFDLGLKSRTMNADKGEASIFVQYRFQCNACNAEDFVGKRYIQKKPANGPGDSFDLCESCFSQHVERQADGHKFFCCPSDDPNILNQVTRLVEADFLVYTTGPDNVRVLNHVGQDL